MKKLTILLALFIPIVANAANISFSGWTVSRAIPERDSLGRNLIEYTTTGYVYIRGYMNTAGPRVRVLCNTDTNPAGRRNQAYFMHNMYAYPGYAPVNMQFYDPRGINNYLPDDVPSDGQWGYTATHPGLHAVSNLYNNEKIHIALWASSGAQTPYIAFFACTDANRQPTITKFIFVE